MKRKPKPILPIFYDMNPILPPSLTKHYQNRNKDKKIYQGLRDKQAPHTLLIGCSDSRIEPQTIFNMPLGEIFTLRHIAALVPPCQTPQALSCESAIFFALTNFHISNILVLGHQFCAGIAHHAQQKTPSSTSTNPVTLWTNYLYEARNFHHHMHLQNADGISLTSPENQCELAGVIMSLRNLMHYECVKKAVNEKSLTLIGGYFEISSAQLYIHPYTHHLQIEKAVVFSPA